MPATINHALSMTTPDNTAYENRPSHWNQTHAITLSATGSEIIGAFSNTNGVSFGLSAGAITASHNALTTAALSNHSHGNPTLNLTNLSGTTASNSAGFTLSLSAGAGGAGDGVNILAAGTQTANTTGTVLFSNSNGISFGLSNSSVITASHNALTTAMASNRGSDFVQATAAFAGTSASGTIASNGISVSIGPYITTAMLSNAATISNIRVSAGTTSNLLSAMTFGDGNGISFGLNASTLTASHNGLTSQSNQNVTAGNGGFAFQTLSFSNVNGISFGTSAGSAITASHNALTTARASNDAVGLNTALTAGPLAWTVNSAGISLNAGSAAGTTTGFGGNLLSASMTHNTAGLNLSLNHPAWLTTAMQSNAVTLSNIRVSGGTTSNLLSAITFGDGNGISFGLNAGTMTASHNALTSQSNQAVSNSAGSFTFQTLNFSNANNVTWGTSAGGIITASVAPPGAAAENNWVNLLGANTAGNTTASGSTIGYSGINLTLSGTNGSVVNISAPATSSLVGTNGISLSSNGSTISISNAAMSYFSFPVAPFANTSSLTLGGSSVFVQPFDFENPISASYVRIPVSQGFGSTSQTTGGVNGSLTFRVTHTYYMQLFTNQGGASSRSLGLAYSTTVSSCMEVRATVTATNGQTVSHFFTYPVTGNSSVGFTTGANPNNASFQVSTTHLTAFNGARFLDIPFATLIQPGGYWMALQMSSASASTSGGQNYSNITAATNRNSYYALTQVSANIIEMGGNTTAGSNMWAGMGHGWWTTNTNGATTSQMNLAQISTIANQPLIPFLIVRQA